MSPIKALIIGGGFAGCSAAHQLELLGNYEVTLIEKSSFLGAGNKTRWYGGHPYTFGPRHFLTQYQETYEYLNSILPIRLCPEHEFLTYVEADERFYSYPINMDDVKSMHDFSQIENELETIKKSGYSGAKAAQNLEEYWIGSVGKTLYSKMIDQYTRKMWNVESNTVIDTFNWSPKGVTLKEGPRAAWDNAISGYPYAPDGYDSYFLFATKDARVLLNTMPESLDLSTKSCTIDGVHQRFDVIVNTIAIDVLMNEMHGPLKYLGRELDLVVFPSEYVFPSNVYFLYYANEERFTRLVEYKKFTHHSSPTSLVGIERPVDNGGYDYPMPFREEQKRCQLYFDELPRGVFSMGRAGSYLYGIDIDDCILQSMLMARQLRDDSQDHPVPGVQYRFPELLAH
jgi:UDP-galactopyranose mutase